MDVIDPVGLCVCVCVLALWVRASSGEELFEEETEWHCLWWCAYGGQKRCHGMVSMTLGLKSRPQRQ